MTSPAPAARPPVALALLAALLAAGCSSGGGGQDANLADTGRIDQTILDPGETAGGSTQTTGGGAADAAAGNGELRGSVMDDAGLPVAEAQVSVTGTELSGKTDDAGAFRFPNVTAGVHGLRVVPPSSIFRVHEGDVTVAAGKVTLVTVTLVPVDGRGPGYRPHLHDYWGAAAELDLFDLELDWAGTGSYSQYGPVGEVLTGVVSPNQATWGMNFGIPERGDGRPPIVLPGTAAIRFTLDWGDDVDVDRFILSAHPGDYQFRDLVIANGASATLDIKPEEADNGHQRFSLWQFRIRPEPRGTPMTILGPIHATATLVKGTLPVDPPHEDFWGPNATYLVRSLESASPGSSICCANAHAFFGPDAKRLVPPGTKELAIQFTWALTRSPGTPLDFEWDLLAKPADAPPSSDLADYRLLEPTKTGPNLKEYLVPVGAAETDAFYQRTSNWRFALRQDPDAPEAVAEFEHTFRIEIVAHKDPAFT